MQRGLVRLRRTVPPGLRLPLGILFCIGGVLGFLPVLGFWMIPLGVALIIMDVRWLRTRRMPRPKPGDDPPSAP